MLYPSQNIYFITFQRENTNEIKVKFKSLILSDEKQNNIT